MEPLQKLYLPRMVILDSDRLVNQIRHELKLDELMNPTESEKTIMEFVSNSMQIASAAHQELEYNCHYLLQDEIPELFYFDTENIANTLVAFGRELFKLMERTKLYNRQGQLFYEFERMLGSSILMSRIDTDPCEVNTHEWTKGYQSEWSRPKHVVVSGMHHPRLQTKCGHVPVRSKEIFGITWT